MTKVNLGIFNEIANNKADRDLRNIDLTKTDVVIEYQEPTEENNCTWYRLYATGWVEQGGRVANSSSDYTVTVTFPIRMADTSYTLVGGEITNASANTYHNHASVGYDKTTTTFKSDMSTAGWKDWYCCGKADMTGHEVLPSKKAIDENDHRVVVFQKPTSANNYTWYRKYADGWVEQGGRVQLNGAISESNKRVTFPIKMENSSYYANASADANVAYCIYVGWQGKEQMSVGTKSEASTGWTTWRVEGLYATE